MTKPIHVLLFYRYITIKNPEEFVLKHLKECRKLGVLGRIVVAEEGINGSVCGTKEQTDKYKKILSTDKRFHGIVFKEEICKTHPFTKIAVKVKKEIVAFKKKVNLNNAGKRISPKEFLELYKKGEAGKDFIILDARNDYEYRFGRFKNAIHLNIKTFRQFPNAIKKLNGMENNKIVMYCTGGVRCEKASAYLREKGFKDVNQLDGGILNFGEQFRNSFWEGKCFVFDKRLITSIREERNNLTKCEICDKECDLCRNCRDFECDKLFVCCVECEKNMNGCCSKKCFDKFKKKCREKSFDNQGKRINNKLVEALIT